MYSTPQLRRSGVRDRDPLHMADRCFPKEVPSGFLSVNSSLAVSAVVDPPPFASAIFNPPPRRAPAPQPQDQPSNEHSMDGGQMLHGGQPGAGGQTSSSGRISQPGGQSGQTGGGRSPGGQSGQTRNPGMGDGPSGAAFVGGLMGEVERLLQVRSEQPKWF
jgi:hypothetical protein